MASPIDFFDRDDGAHPISAEEYYEWWYLDAMFPSGWKCAITMFLRTSPGPDHSPMLLLDVYAPDGRKLRAQEVFAPGAAVASAEKCDLKIGSNTLRQEGERWLLSVKSGKVGADLVFTRTVPGWKGDPTGLIVNDATGQQGWCNPIPRADVEGTLYFDGAVAPVKGGLGYHDHDWGSSAIERSMGGWGWGRAHTDRYTFVYGWLLPPGDTTNVRPSLFLARGNKPIFVLAGLPCKLSGFRKHEETGYDIPTLVEFGGKAPWGVEAQVKLTLTGVLDWIRDPGAHGIETMYFRRLSRLEARIFSDGVWDETAGDAFDEYVLMPRK